jgi:hypothetical protein
MLSILHTERMSPTTLALRTVAKPVVGWVSGKLAATNRPHEDRSVIDAHERDGWPSMRITTDLGD